MKNLTKGQMEAEISNIMTKFEKEHLGRGPKEACTFILEDMILVRLKGVLTPAEEKLAVDQEGAQLVKQMRRRLIESSRTLFEEIIQNITGTEVISLHTDVSSRTGERIFVFCLSENLDKKLAN